MVSGGERRTFGGGRLMMKIMMAVVTCTALAFAADMVFAKSDKGQGGGPDKPGAAGQEHGKGHKHNHKNGHNLLGAKLKQDGKHALGKLKEHDLVAEVKGGKVHNMTAGDMPVKHFRTKEKMVLNGGVLQFASNGPIQLAQYDDYYYGYCFYDDYDDYCYWYPADDVYYEDTTWDEYDTYW